MRDRGRGSVKLDSGQAQVRVRSGSGQAQVKVAYVPAVMHEVE